MKIAIYARSAVVKPAFAPNSIERQIADVRRWAAKNNHILIMVFREVGPSRVDDQRPVLNGMLAQAMHPDRPFDAIVVSSFSRLTRDNTALTTMTTLLSKAC